MNTISKHNTKINKRAQTQYWNSLNSIPACYIIYCYHWRYYTVTIEGITLLPLKVLHLLPLKVLHCYHWRYYTCYHWRYYTFTIEGITLVNCNLLCIYILCIYTVLHSLVIVIYCDHWRLHSLLIVIYCNHCRPQLGNCNLLWPL